MTCSSIKFGKTNCVPDATITATPAVSSGIDLDNLKNEWRARIVKWDDPSVDIVIDFTLSYAVVGEYFSLPNSNLTAGSSVKLELFENTNADPDLLNEGFTEYGKLLPLGEWRVGIDKFGATYDQNPDGLTMWFDSPIIFRAGRITITNNAAAQAELDDVRLRMFLIGESMTLSKNFSYGAEISFFANPHLTETTSGSTVPTRLQRKRRFMSLDLDAMKDGDRFKMRRLEESLQGDFFLVSGYPDKNNWQFDDYTFLARFATGLTFAHKTATSHGTSIGLREV